MSLANSYHAVMKTSQLAVNANLHAATAPPPRTLLPCPKPPRSYDAGDSSTWQALSKELCDWEEANAADKGSPKGRLFYLALPPNVYLGVSCAGFVGLWLALGYSDRCTTLWGVYLSGGVLCLIRRFSGRLVRDTAA